MADNRSDHVARRSFFSRFGAGMTAFGAAMFVGGAQSRAAEATAFQPARHTEDDWLDQVPGKHRLVFDTISPSGLGLALLFANNYFAANQSGYSLAEADNAVVIVMRHNATPFAFTDVIWAKYGAPIAKRAAFEDPKTKQAPVINVYNSTEHASLLASRANTIASLTKRGVRLAVCQMATRAYAGSIAEATGGTADSVFKELSSNLLQGGRLVPAGIVAINRAQERGYALAHGG